MDRLFKGGCRKIHWGLETNDPSIIKTMNKKTEVSYTDDILRLSGEAGVLNFCFILIRVSRVKPMRNAGAWLITSSKIRISIR